MSHTVLFVDDSQMVLEAIKRTLHRERYSVEIALGPYVGLDKIGACSPDVIVTDMRMPEMDGIGFLQEAYKKRPEAIYMVLSAYADIEKILASINQHHVWRYIGKPWQNEELKQAISNALELFEHREEKKRFLQSLEEKNRELHDLNAHLEEKVLERTAQLEEKNEILQMLAEDVSTHDIMKKICTALSRLLSVSPVYIDSPVLSTVFSDNGSTPSPKLRNTGAEAMRKHVEIFVENRIAVPLIKGDVVLGVLLAETVGAEDHGSFAQDRIGYLSAATLCLMQAKNLTQTPDLPSKIDKLLGDL